MTHHAVLGFKPDWYHVSTARRFLQGFPGATSWLPVVWCDVERSPGEWNWSAPDRIAAQARSLGVRVHVRIRVGACWLTQRQAQHRHGTNSESQMPTDLQAYAAFVKATVNRYSGDGIHEFAVENEPNTAYQWGGTLAQLMRLTAVAATAIRRTDPDAVVADWGMSTGVYGNAVAQRLLMAGHPARAVAAFNAYYRTARQPEHASSPDQLKTMLYTGQSRRDLVYLAADARLLDRHVFDTRQLHFYESAAVLPAVLAYLRATTPADIPVQAWELGRSTDPMTGAARAEMVKSVCLLLAAGVREIDWLPLKAPQSSDESLFALVDDDGTVRPAGNIYRHLARLVRSASYIRATAVPGVSGVAIGNSRQTTLVLWASQGDGTRASDAAVLRLPASARVRTLTGSAAPGSLRSQTAALQVDADPLLVTIDAPPRQALAEVGPSGGTAVSPPQQ
ncbi:MAG TPA: hypothetical protein VFJ19_20990 [Nocardioidaceae bacterium]|nr:hypothetical protein [Nocardioidaceae bacterium]